MSGSKDKTALPTRPKLTRGKYVAPMIGPISELPAPPLSPLSNGSVTPTPPPLGAKAGSKTPGPIEALVDDWQVSTASSSHVTNSKHWFKAGTYQESRLRRVRTGNGEVSGEGTGTVEIRPALPDGQSHTIQLNNVLYMPNYPTSIFSAAMLYKNDKGYISKDNLYVTNSGEEQDTLIAKLKPTRFGLFLCLEGNKWKYPTRVDGEGGRNVARAREDFERSVPSVGRYTSFST